jgi:nucleoside-diphosphate-sugar epimerase
MRILLLGGTGSIGRSVLHEFVRAGYEVLALARSEASARRQEYIGASVLKGDLRQPKEWVSRLPRLDGIVNVAGTFAEDEEATDRELLDHLLPHVRNTVAPTRFIYTGGCWLYGPTDGTVTTEETPFLPLPAFSWAVGHIERLQAEHGISPIVIHPAMVYSPTSGVFGRMYQEAAAGRAVRVVGAESVRWPLVHCDDLAALYRLALEKAPAGDSYIGCAITGVAVGQIARAFARLRTSGDQAPLVMSEEDAVAEFGDWAIGYGRDQLQSGQKAQRTLGWKPFHLDPLAEIAQLGKQV